MQRPQAQLGPMSVLGIRLRNTIIRRYSERGAKRYETHRHGARWEAEAKVFEEFYRRIDPTRVLDCPVGTGRWFDLYRASGASVRGFDISSHMLAEAAKKIGPEDKIEIERADVLDEAQAQTLGHGYDLIVCWRFVYWLRPHELKLLGSHFRATESRYLLVGAKVAREKSGRSGKATTGWTFLKRMQANFYRSLVKRLYEETELIQILQSSGWRLVDKQPIIATRSIRYACYLFSHGGGPSA